MVVNEIKLLKKINLVLSIKIDLQLVFPRSKFNNFKIVKTSSNSFEYLELEILILDFYFCLK